MSTSLAESVEDLSQSNPQILRIEKITRRPSYDVDDEFDTSQSRVAGVAGAIGERASVGNSPKVVEKKTQLDRVLPDYIRLRPDLRPSIEDANIVQWKSVSHPRSTATRLEMQARTNAAAENAAYTKKARDSYSIGNKTNNSPTSSARESLEFLAGANRSILVPEGINPEALIKPDVREKLSRMSDEQRMHRLTVMRQHRAGTPPKVFTDYINELVGKIPDKYKYTSDNTNEINQLSKSTKVYIFTLNNMSPYAI